MKLLIVDDEMITTQVLEEQLDREYLGLEKIYTAYHVTAAEEILRREKIDIVLCDVEMPQASGLELLDWVRMNQKEMDFLFLTSHDKFEYIFGAMQQGAASYLLKPIDIPKIQQELFKVIDKNKKQKQLNEVQKYWHYGKNRILRSFWRTIIFGDITGAADIQKEIKKQGLEHDVKELYSLVLFLFRKENIFKKGESQNLNQFIIDNILAETLTDTFEMANCIHWEENEQYYVVVVSEKAEEEAGNQISRIKSVLEQYYDDPVRAVYISNEGPVSQLGAYRKQISEYATAHIYENGEVLFFDRLRNDEGKLDHILDQRIIFQ